MVTSRIGFPCQRIVLTICVLLYLSIAITLKVQAQTTGTIYGKITDSAGAAVSGATVTAENKLTGLRRTAATNAEGSYNFTLLPVGQYTVSVEASGFRPTEQSEVELQVAANLRIDLKLDVGQVSDKVVVTAEVPQVDTATATLGKVVESQRIVDLPLNGRNFLQLGVLQAGVAPPITNINVVGSGTNNTPGGTSFNFAVNGQRITSNNHLLDGVNNVEPVTGSAMVVPNPDALQEFKILTSSYNAEYGRAGGSIVTVLTKSGTKDFHGTVYEFLRNDILDARNFFAPDVPALKQNQFGFTFGGPVYKSRTFFFGGYEGYRQRKGIPISAPVPSLAVRRGDFSGEAIKPIDPFTRQPFPNNRIPAERIDRVAQNLLKLWPEPNLGTNTWTSAPSGANDRNQFLIRGDHTLIEGKNTLTGRFVFDKGKNFLPLGHFASNSAPFIQVPGFQNEESNTFQNFMLADTHIFSPKWINEFRFSYQRANVNDGKSVNPLDPKSLGFTYPVVSSISVAPSIGVSGITGLGPPIFSNRVYNFYQFSDNVVVNTSNNSFKFGADIRHTRLFSFYTSIANGAYTFNGLVSNNAQADLLLGLPFIFIQAAGKEDKSLRQTSYYFYAQDDYKARSNLTLNLGLRYELSPGFTERDNLLLTFIPGKKSTLSPTLPTGLVHSGDPGVPETLFPTQKKNFGPRVGIAWDPFGNGRTSVRAGYGIFFDESGLVQTYNVYQAPDYQPIAVVILPGILAPGSLADPFGGKSTFVPPLKFPIPVGPGTTATWIAPDLKPAYIQHWNLTVQRQLTTSTAVEVAYVGNKATRLQGNIDVNQAVLTPDATSQNIAARRPFPQLGSTFQVSSIFASNYHGFQGTVTQRLNHGLSFQASYTWSKAIDDTTIPTAFFLIPGQNAGRPQDNRNLRAERGLSAFDLRHRFVFSYIYELPFLKNGNNAASYIFGGWRLNGILSLQSGHPFTIGDTRDPNLDSVTENDRPDVLRNPNLSGDQRRPERWFDTLAFARPTTKRQGTSGRNIVESDGVVNYDFGLSKQFKLGERPKIEFRWEIFNLFNHANFGIPVSDFNSPRFGQVLNTSTPERQMQFALKFIF